MYLKQALKSDIFWTSLGHEKLCLWGTYGNISNQMLVNGWENVGKLSAKTLVNTIAPTLAQCWPNIVPMSAQDWPDISNITQLTDTILYNLSHETNVSSCFANIIWHYTNILWCCSIWIWHWLDIWNTLIDRVRVDSLHQLYDEVYIYIYIIFINSDTELSHLVSFLLKPSHCWAPAVSISIHDSCFCVGKIFLEASWWTMLTMHWFHLPTGWCFHQLAPLLVIN